MVTGTKENSVAEIATVETIAENTGTIEEITETINTLRIKEEKLRNGFI